MRHSLRDLLFRLEPLWPGRQRGVESDFHFRFHMSTFTRQSFNLHLVHSFHHYPPRHPRFKQGELSALQRKKLIANKCNCPFIVRFYEEYKQSQLLKRTWCNFLLLKISTVCLHCKKVSPGSLLRDGHISAPGLSLSEVERGVLISRTPSPSTWRQITWKLGFKRLGIHSWKVQSWPFCFMSH